MGCVDLVELPQVAEHKVALHGGKLTTSVKLEAFMQGGNAADQAVGGRLGHVCRYFDP